MRVPAPMCMEKVKDEPSGSDDAARLRLQSFASASGSLSTGSMGSMSSEGGLEMRRQLRASLHVPLPQAQAIPKEVQRHQPRPTLSFPVPQPLSVRVEGTERRTSRRETWHHGQTLDALHGNAGLGVRSARGSNSTPSSFSSQGTARAQSELLTATDV